MSAQACPIGAEQYLRFFVAGEEYAVGILKAREIIEHTAMTRLPSMPVSVRGVINLRGKVVPVIDMATLLGLPETQVTRWTCIVVIEVDADEEHTIVGVLVDSVSGVLDLGEGDIEPPPTFGTRIRTDFLKGMGKSGEKFVLLADVDKLLCSSNLLAGASAVVAQGEQEETEQGAPPTQPASLPGTGLEKSPAPEPHSAS